MSEESLLLSAEHLEEIKETLRRRSAWSWAQLAELVNAYEESQQKVSDLEARNARLAAALEKIAIKLGNLDSIDIARCNPDFTCNLFITVSNSDLHAIRAALTADDRKAGEYLRALEAEHEAVEALFENGGEWIDGGGGLVLPLTSLSRAFAAVRAVEEKKNGTEESER